ncbi:MAG: Methyltransferase [Polaromonas sp.]|nr:Methyltransferase [Polaromonas sp.]
MPRALWAAPLRAHADEAGAGLAEVIDGPQRSAANRARDAARHPYDTLRFFGLAPWQTVIEIAPGGGWYTEILAPYLRDHGRLYAAWDAGDGPQNAAARARFAARLAGDPQVFGKVVLGTMPGAGQGFAGIAPRGGADSVLTFRNVHNWIERGELDAMLRAFHGVLKPGGVLGVEEHRAAPGTPLSRVIATGYVPEAFLIARARAAGFELAGTSEVNANPRDTRDHPNGVWSLPPTLRGGEQDRARLQAIGESDRMTLRFIKLPA